MPLAASIERAAFVRRALWEVAQIGPVPVFNAILGDPHSGKRPAGGKQWELRAARRPPLDAYATPDPRATNTGALLAPALISRDVDIDDPIAAEREAAIARDIFGDNPAVRFRSNSPRTCSLYRLEFGIPYERIDIDGGHIEFRSGNMQAVVDGYHHTGVPLEWTTPIWDLRYDEIPIISREQVNAYRKAIAPLPRQASRNQSSEMTGSLQQIVLGDDLSFATKSRAEFFSDDGEYFPGKISEREILEMEEPSAGGRFQTNQRAPWTAPRCYREWAMGVLREIPQIVWHRYGNTTIATGNRDHFLCVATMMIAVLVPAAEVQSRAREFTRPLLDTAFHENCALKYISTIIDRAHQTEAGEFSGRYDQHGNPYGRTYTPGRDWIIRELGVTRDEMQALDLEAIVSDAEKRMRRNRQNGAQPRSEYEANAQAKANAMRPIVNQLREIQGWTWHAIAERLGASITQVRRWANGLKSEAKTEKDHHFDDENRQEAPRAQPGDSALPSCPTESPIPLSTPKKSGCSRTPPIHGRSIQTPPLPPPERSQTYVVGARGPPYEANADPPNGEKFGRNSQSEMKTPDWLQAEEKAAPRFESLADIAERRTRELDAEWHAARLLRWWKLRGEG